ncbi:MAG: hypothetical protein K1Y36_03940 [Blastocatellia bacterium]|nr:hypothetical protein [Blastocatellia bacterium]
MYWLWVALSTIVFLILLPLGETLWWWRCWSRQAQVGNPQKSGWKTAVVHLSGVSDFTAGGLIPEQTAFWESLRQEIPHDLLVAEAFPYEPLTGKYFHRFDLWRRIGRSAPPLWVMSLRNFWQALVASWWERKFGNAAAQVLVNRIGFPNEQAQPTLVLIGGSAGAALGLAVLRAIPNFMRCRCILVTYGGVFGNSPALNSHIIVYHLLGRKDWWGRAATVLFPGRWLPGSRFQQALAQQRVRLVQTGEHEHFGSKGYLSLEQIPGKPLSYARQTLILIKNLGFWESCTCDKDTHAGAGQLPSTTSNPLGRN